MPTYEYECRQCGHRFEQFQSITENPITRCPACKKPKARRLIGRGAGILFKGSGFYQTDYRSDHYRKQSAAEKKTAGTPGEKPAAGGKPATGGKPGTPAASAPSGKPAAAP